MPLEAVATDLWIADGSPVPFLGIPYPTRMALARLPDGRLWVWSPIALDDALAAEIATHGEVADLVAPNKLHHLFLTAWAARWPAARLWAAPGLRRRRPDLAFAGDLGDVPEPGAARDRPWHVGARSRNRRPASLARVASPRSVAPRRKPRRNRLRSRRRPC